MISGFRGVGSLQQAAADAVPQLDYCRIATERSSILSGRHRGGYRARKQLSDESSAKLLGFSMKHVDGSLFESLRQPRYSAVQYPRNSNQNQVCVREIRPVAYKKQVNGNQRSVLVQFEPIQCSRTSPHPIKNREGWELR